MVIDLLASVDPGQHGNGVAIFLAGRLVHAEYAGVLEGQVHPALRPEEPTTEVLTDVAMTHGPIDLLVVEVPQVYDQQKQSGRQEDLIQLALVAGAVLRGARPCVRKAIDVKAARWKGQVDKPIMIKRVMSKLSFEEHAAVVLPSAKGLHHNVWDAIGIGLWRLGRIGK